jgi:hypothetical protein
MNAVANLIFFDNSVRFAVDLEPSGSRRTSGPPSTSGPGSDLAVGNAVKTPK